jgi:hypothetical protein
MGRKPLPDDQKRKRWQVYVTDEEREQLQRRLDAMREVPFPRGPIVMEQAAEQEKK